MCSGSKTPTPGWGSEFVLRLSKTKPRWEEIWKRVIFLMTCFKTCFVEYPVYWFILFVGFVILASWTSWCIYHLDYLAVKYNFFTYLLRLFCIFVRNNKFKPHIKIRKGINPCNNAIMCLHTLHMWLRIKLWPYPVLSQKGLGHTHF